MRSDRRHELQTNELSTQIEKVSETVKQNATLLTAVIGGAIVVIAVGVWFVNQRANAQSDAWSRLGAAGTADASTSELLADYEAVAKDNVSPAITRSAYLMIGRTALEKLRQNRDQSEAADPDGRKELRSRAEAAFNAVVSNPADDFTALGRALMGLGTIAEDRGEFDKAKSYYEKVKANDKLKATPIADEAEYRLAHMSEWSTMIEFPEPPSILLTTPETTPPPSASSFTGAAPIKPMTEVTPTDDSTDGSTDDATTDADDADATDAEGADASADGADDVASDDDASDDEAATPGN